MPFQPFSSHMAHDGMRDLRFEAPRPMLASEMTFIEVKIIYLTGGFLGIRKKIATLDPI